MSSNNIAHNLRNDLSSAVALCELGKLSLQQGHCSNDEITALLSDVLSELHKMAQRIDQMEQDQV